MAQKITGGPIYIARGASLDLEYSYPPGPTGGANMGGRYAYALPVASGGTDAWVVTAEQGVSLHDRGPRAPRGWLYRFTVRNDGPAGAWFDGFVVGLDGLP